MTRSTLQQFALISAGALGAGIAAAALAQSTWAGLASTARYLAIVGATGTVASAAWHGVRILLEHHEEHMRAERRHRVPRPDRAALWTPDAPEQPADAAPPAGFRTAPEPETPRDPAIQQAFDDFAERIDPYRQAPAPRWMSQTEADQYEDLYAHPPVSST